MSVDEKVGQLFLVSFPGTDTSQSSDIADLITNYRVGGVQLKASNQNVTNSSDGAYRLADLTNRLQTLAAITETVPTVEPGVTRTAVVSPRSFPSGIDFIPLFIATAEEGDGAPNSEITQGITQVPSELAIGATWHTDNASIVGQIAGKELSLMGINVLFGPVLDVLDDPKTSTPYDLGTRVFGGDPYWVGKFGQQYISGVHIGSKNRIAVISSRFPGLGSADRSVEDEIPTVQKSLEQLKQIELAPFFAVTQLDNDKPVTSTTDGLLVSHIRYRGFQGNIRATSRPVSLDPKAYQALMTLPEIAPWRNAGGVTFSDSLGVRGVRRFYDPLDLTFNARRVAQEAFLAGNDVLTLGGFGLTSSWQEQLANIKDTIQFFRERYVSDQTFAARVDSALTRIIALKLKIYQGDFTLGNVIDIPNLASAITPNNEIIANIAKQAITLLSPSARDLPALVPTSPGKDESIVFITDDRQIKECPKCASYSAIPRNALRDIALNLYGPNTTGQLIPSHVSAYTFSELAAYNTRPSVATSATVTVTNTATPISGTASVVTPALPTDAQRIQASIDGADLIVFAMLDLNPDVKSTKVFRDFLAQSADALRDKRVVVFAFGAPYYLDTTEISKLTAYYGVYSHVPVFLEAAIRALFGEYPSEGASPISIKSLNYTLLSETAPDPNQVIPLTAVNPVSSTETTASSLEMKIGDKIKLRAGPIVDRNNHLVPDGTQVQFVLAYPTERVEQQQTPISTKDGIAETTVVIERKGTLEIRAQADPALSSYVIRVNIGDNAASIETIKPTALPTVTPEPTPTPTEQPTVPVTIASTPVVTPQTPQIIARSSIGGFVIALLALVVIALVAILALNGTNRVRPNLRWRVVLLSWSSGWIGYVVYAAGIPGTSGIAEIMGWVGSVILTVIVSTVVLLAGVVVVILAEDQPVKPFRG
ncbi:MAG: hypothetical protein M1140_01070 [Chloroflexi bacterium]|nr:hypothetical protein [Chloroflexota bacterium]